ncbi:MAG: hypothetical protein NVSMB31_16060 [Vulcanimicrobiaceae bacterium]
MPEVTARKSLLLFVFITILLLIFSVLSFAFAAEPSTNLHHLMRRFAFSASPQEMQAASSLGANAWLEGQLHPRSIDDSAMQALLEGKPSFTNGKGDLDDPAVYARRLLERELYSKRQVQEKLVLHWIEHFSVGVSKIDNHALMSRYEETLRYGALGNFASLLVSVSKSPAMLIWLDNNDNSSADGAKPNENFARELLQLYIMGTDRLNMDGTIQRDGQGRAVPNYTQSDVRELAIALSGWGLTCDDEAHRKRADTCSISYHADEHRTGTRKLLGWTIHDDASSSTLPAIIAKLARHQSTAPFQAKELLQRFVTEHPSPHYVADIARVWSRTAGAPDQIASVVRAIVQHPEFNAGYHELLKEPVEAFVDAMRSVPSVLQDAKTDDGPVARGMDLVADGGFLQNCGQSLYDPPSVFSFYRPGHKADLLADHYLAARFAGLGTLSAADLSEGSTNSGFNFELLAQRIGSDDPHVAATYLVDALSDSETSQLTASLEAYLQDGVDAEHLRGAVWLIFTSAEYQLN